MSSRFITATAGPVTLMSGSTVTINPDQFRSENVFSPPPSQIIITQPPTSTSAPIIDFTSLNFKVQLLFNGPQSQVLSTSGIAGVKPTIDPNPTPTTRQVTIDFHNTDSTASKDKYVFLFDFTQGNTFTSPVITITLSRDKFFSIDDTVGANTTVMSIPQSTTTITQNTANSIASNTANNIALNTSDNITSNTANSIALNNINFTRSNILRTCNCVKPNIQEIISGNINPLTLNKQNILGVKECPCINVPILNIEGQTLIDGSDIGDNIFTIIDKFQYYCIDDIPPKDNHCGVFHVKESQLKVTQFRRCCPKIVSVVKGEGETLYDKLENIFRTLGEEEIGVDFETFYTRIFFYAMLKFSLARIRYGKFNIDFLLGKFNEKFLRDLGNSRFCEALHLFLDCDSIVFGYNRYFKFDNKCQEEKDKKDKKDNEIKHKCKNRK